MTAYQQQIIDKTVVFVKRQMGSNEGGHDYWHVYRVRKTAEYIAQKEKADIFVVTLGALLHDIADAKFYNGDESKGSVIVRDFLHSLRLPHALIAKVEHIIRYVSFKNRYEVQGHLTPELSIVQDADRIDAIGAIGIARAFNYGGYKNRPLHNPAVPPQIDQSKEDYKNSTAPSINHFYEKLLLLKDMMNTETGRQLAQQRHRYMEEFLEQFFKEWDAEFD